eukprot:3039681-Rhodomonas_salina.1
MASTRRPDDDCTAVPDTTFWSWTMGGRVSARPRRRARGPGSCPCRRRGAGTRRRRTGCARRSRAQQSAA